MTEEQNKILDYMYLKNEASFNILKGIEELNELATALTQKLSKPTKNNDKNLHEEFGDVKIRLAIIERALSKEKLEERIAYKLNKYKFYIDNKMFKNI